MTDQLTNPLQYDLRIEVDVRPPEVEVILSGELDFACCDHLGAAAETIPAGTAEVVVDLSRLSFCDVAGMRALLTFRDKQKACGRLVKVRNPDPWVVRLAHLVGRPDLVATVP